MKSYKEVSIMKKTILTSIAISVGASVIAGVSYHVGKFVGGIEFGLECLKAIEELRNNSKK